MNYTIEQLDAMEGHDFEYAVADLLLHNGWRDVKVTKGSGDYGIDILARRGSTTYAIQCKRYNKSVGVPAVQQAGLGMDYYHCDAAAVITNNTFTPNAMELANTTGVRLFDRNDLAILINEYDDEYDEIYSHIQHTDTEKNLNSSIILPTSSSLKKNNVNISMFPKVCPVCGREFQSHSVKCPVCKCELINNSSQQQQQSKRIVTIPTSPKNKNDNLKQNVKNSQWTSEDEILYKKAQTAFILCLFLGYFGIHRLYMNKIGTGILWLFTGGLFVIGWFIDSINLGIVLGNLSVAKRKSDM